MDDCLNMLLPCFRKRMSGACVIQFCLGWPAWEEEEEEDMSTVFTKWSRCNNRELEIKSVEAATVAQFLNVHKGLR